MSLFLRSSWGWVSGGTEGRAGLLAEVYSDLRESLVLLLLWEGSPSCFSEPRQGRTTQHADGIYTFQAWEREVSQTGALGPQLL